MLFEDIVIAGLAHVEAPHRIATSHIEDYLADTLDRVGLPPGMFQQLTGIEARRWWDPGVQPDEIAAWVGEKVIEQVGVDRARIGVLMNTSVCRQYLEPATACMVHHRLKLSPRCRNFDVSNACLAFLNAMELGAMMIGAGQTDYVLIVDGEGSREIQEATLERLSGPTTTAAEIRDQIATLTLGSGGAAMLLSRRALHPDAPRFEGGAIRAATEWNHLCRGTHTHMRTDSRAMLQAGTDLARPAFADAAELLGWSDATVDHILMHQVSLVHTRQISLALGLDPSKAWISMVEHGNVGSASIPFTWSQGIDAGRARPGDHLALLGMGSGLNAACMRVVW